jgi:putative ATPase
MAFFDALAAVESEREGEVPNAMRDASRDQKGFGHGAGYLYPHAYRDHWVAQQYLPGSLQGQVFYQPSDQGYEAGIQSQVARRREAQLAALVERNAERFLPEALTFGPSDPQQDKWLQRATGVLGEQLGMVRDRIFNTLNPQRHHVLLDLNASTGLLTWEAVRRVPEGGVLSCVQSEKDYDALVEQSAMLSELARPKAVKVTEQNWLEALKKQSQKESSIPIVFDGIIGRNVLMALEDKLAAIEQLKQLLNPNGTLVLAESVPSRGQRLSQLLDVSDVDSELFKQLSDAESKLFHDPEDALVNWDVPDLQRHFETVEWVCDIEIATFQTPLMVTSALLDRWLGEHGKYAKHLKSCGISAADFDPMRVRFAQQLKNKTVMWNRSTAFVKASIKAL